MTDKTGMVYKMFILRDPWGMTDYNLDWAQDDPRWTPDMVAQIPEGVSPFNTTKTGYIFMDQKILSQCFDDF